MAARSIARRLTARLERSHAGRWWKCRAGGATLELAMVAPMLALLAVGGFDFGNLALHKLAATSAARAGVQYGSQDVATATNSSAIVQAALDDAGNGHNALSVTARQFSYCPGEGEVAGTALCGDGSFSMMYVEVTVQEPYEYLMVYPGLSSPQTILSTVRMRVR